jgi:hypothetical protein
MRIVIEDIRSQGREAGIVGRVRFTAKKMERILDVDLAAGTCLQWGIFYGSLPIPSYTER